jgi:hypothetical protein
MYVKYYQKHIKKFEAILPELPEVALNKRDRVEVIIGNSKLSCLRGQKEVKALIARVKKGKAAPLTWTKPKKIRGSSWQVTARNLARDGDEYGAYCLYRDKGAPRFTPTSDRGVVLFLDSTEFDLDPRFILGRVWCPRATKFMWSVIGIDSGLMLAGIAGDRAVALKASLEKYEQVKGDKLERAIARSIPDAPLEQQFLSRFDV